MCKLCKFLFVLHVIHGALNAYVVSVPKILLNAVLWNQMVVKLLQKGQLNKRNSVSIYTYMCTYTCLYSRMRVSVCVNVKLAGFQWRVWWALWVRWLFLWIYSDTYQKPFQNPYKKNDRTWFERRKAHAHLSLVRHFLFFRKPQRVISQITPWCISQG